MKRSTFFYLIIVLLLMNNQAKADYRKGYYKANHTYDLKLIAIGGVSLITIAGICIANGLGSISIGVTPSDRDNQLETIRALALTGIIGLVAIIFYATDEEKKMNALRFEEGKFLLDKEKIGLEVDKLRLVEKKRELEQKKIDLENKRNNHAV